jgi:hypothetical protein
MANAIGGYVIRCVHFVARVAFADASGHAGARLIHERYVGIKILGELGSPRILIVSK